MSQSNRREFLGQIGFGGDRHSRTQSSAVARRFARLPQPPKRRPPHSRPSGAMYDLLIAGGRVIDPSQKLSAERDVAIVGGQDRSRRGEHSAEPGPSGLRRQRQDRDARADRHAHACLQVWDHAQRRSGCGRLPVGSDDLVDAGSTGAGTFMGFRKYVIDSAASRIYALLNISTIGLVVTNEIYLDPRMIDARAAIRVIGQQSRSHSRPQGPGQRQTQRPGARSRGDESGARGL